MRRRTRDTLFLSSGRNVLPSDKYLANFMQVWMQATGEGDSRHLTALDLQESELKKKKSIRDTDNATEKRFLSQYKQT
jgi:hypothetical protein